jgi:hypothetical protein
MGEELPAVDGLAITIERLDTHEYDDTTMGVTFDNLQATIPSLLSDTPPGS